MKKRIIIISVIVGLLLVIVVKLAANKKVLTERNKPVINKGITIPVTTAKAFKGEVNQDIVKIATIAPFQQTDIMPAIPGKIIGMNFELGQKISKGQVLVMLDTRLSELNLESSELTAAKLKGDYDRYNELLEGNATTQTNVNDIQYNYLTAENKVQQNKKQIADGRIISPISGIITKKSREEGEYVSSGTVLGTVVDVSKLKIKLVVTETEVYRLKEGQTVKVTSDIYPNTDFTAKVSYVSPAGDEAHNYAVELTMSNNSAHPLKAGTYVKAYFSNTSNEETLQIPRDALAESVKNPYVYVVNSNNEVSIRKIKVGREFGATIEVLDGLQEGETVVTSGQINLSDKTQVQIVK